MKEIKLTQGKVAIIDDVDYAELSKYKWYARLEGKVYYAQRGVKKSNGKRTIQRMHRFLMNPSVGIGVDHIDGNGLNNQRSNLRLCNQSENCRNQRAVRGGSSKYKGVDWFKLLNKWRAKIYVNHKSVHLGVFASEEDAASAYNNTAVKYFGEFAKPNEVAA